MLTPNLVVFGRSLNPLPYGENEISDEDEDPTYIPDETELDSRWRKQASRIAKFREQFQQEYFSELRKRHIYDHRRDPNTEANIHIQTGDLVLIHSDIKKRPLWELAEVTGVVESQADGKIRAAHLRTKEGTTTRPFQKIFPLLDADKLRPNKEQREIETTSVSSPTPTKQPKLQQNLRPRRKAAGIAALKIKDQLQD